MTVSIEKKRKRGKGPFICKVDGCGKSFSRSDHLTRHQVVHSTERHVCGFPGCDKGFTRLDVKKKHELTHNKPNTTFYQYNNNNGYVLSENENDSNSNGLTNQELPSSNIGQAGNDISGSPVIEDYSGENWTNTTTQNIKNLNDNILPLDMSNIGISNNIDSSSSSNLTPKELNNSIPEHITSSHRSVNYTKELENNSVDHNKSSTTPIYSSEIVHWLLGDPLDVSPTSALYLDQISDGAFHTNQDDPIGMNTISMLEKVFALSPEFPNENCQTEVDEKIINNMIQYIPELKNNPDFTIPKIKWFLELYWSLYHCQYPIIHRPSFSTSEAHPLFLLSLIMTGASLAKKVTIPDIIRLQNPSNLAITIAEPLRWLLFANENAKPPCKSWVIQSLIILESYEIISPKRSLHERACIYNGTKIQLLRRSPILGGDPLKSHGSDTSRKINLWDTWIESESMKRAALMSFNIDTIHAIVFGHPLSIFANQIKLSLPCPDNIWEYKNVDRNKASNHVVETPLFSDALKNLLKGEQVNVDSFGRQILLSGLINLILQIEQNISQWSNFGWKTFEKNWRNEISTAIKSWKSQLPDGDCCLTLSSVYYAGATSPPLPPSLMPEDTRCKFPVYHAAQIYLRISHYDYIVFAGAPKRMNVPILPEDYEAVVKRIDKWCKEGDGKLSVINSLILLSELLLSPEGSVETVNYYYEPDKDPFIYRPNVIISAILSLWAYAFHVYGPESMFKSPDPRQQLKSGFIPAMEDGSYYLRRIRTALTKKTGNTFSSLNHMDAKSHKKAIEAYCDALSEINGLNHLIGLLRTIETSYLGCEWQVGREYAKLLGNCIKRSAGSKHVLCDDMYDV